jgi:hypothetical protein
VHVSCRSHAEVLASLVGIRDPNEVVMGYVVEARLKQPLG